MREAQSGNGGGRLILASASTARHALLSRIAATFETCAADIDESPLPDEPARELALRLATEKAEAGAQRLDTEAAGATIIGSDQVAECSGRILGKPGDAARNVDMLMRLSGQQVHFHTAVTIIDAAFAAPRSHVDLTTVAFRSLQRDAVEAYVAVDQPWHCAGGFKVEQAGIGLFRRVTSDDPTALIGLPLIFVAEALRECGYAALPAGR